MKDFYSEHMANIKKEGNKMTVTDIFGNKTRMFRGVRRCAKGC